MGADDARTEKRRFPAVPDDEIPFFRAACRDVLSKPDFCVVDKAFRKSFDSASRWLQDRHDLSEEQVGAFLAGELGWRTDVNGQLTRLRGAQVAFLRHWWLLKVASRRSSPRIASRSRWTSTTTSTSSCARTSSRRPVRSPRLRSQPSWRPVD